MSWGGLCRSRQRGSKLLEEKKRLRQSSLLCWGGDRRGGTESRSSLGSPIEEASCRLGLGCRLLLAVWQLGAESLVGPDFSNHHRKMPFSACSAPIGCPRPCRSRLGKAVCHCHFFFALPRVRGRKRESELQRHAGRTLIIDQAGKRGQLYHASSAYSHIHESRDRHAASGRHAIDVLNDVTSHSFQYHNLNLLLGVEKLPTTTFDRAPSFSRHA